MSINTPSLNLRVYLATLTFSVFALGACTDDSSFSPTSSNLEQIGNDQSEGGHGHNFGKGAGHDHLSSGGNDTYCCFDSLKHYEPNAYEIKTRRRRSRTIVMAIHGGGIEAGTSELASDIAGNNHDFYAFEGVKNNGNGTLHITSTNFDEPIALNMVGAANRCVSLHGFDSNNDSVYVGGRDIALRNSITTALLNWGFKATNNPPSGYKGTSVNNIANKTSINRGVQIEISKSLRQSMFGNFSGAQNRANTKNIVFLKFLIAVRSAL